MKMELYNVEPRVLVQAVKRNIDRFPRDFMFQLSADEFFNLKSQIVTSSWDGPRRAKLFSSFVLTIHFGVEYVIK